MKTKLTLLLSIFVIISISCKSEKIYLYGTPIKAKDVVGINKFNPPNQSQHSPLISKVPLVLKNRYENLGKLVNSNFREPVSLINNTKWKDTYNEIDEINFNFLKNYIYYNLSEFNLTEEQKVILKNSLDELKEVKDYRQFKDSLFLDKNIKIRELLNNKLLFVSHPVAFKIDDKIRKNIKTEFNLKASLKEILKNTAYDTLSAKIERKIDVDNIIEGKFYHVSLNPTYEDRLREFFKTKRVNHSNSVFNTIDELKKEITKKTNNNNNNKVYLTSSAVILDLKIDYTKVRKVLDTIKNELGAKLEPSEISKIEAKINYHFDNDRTTNTKTDTEKIFLIKYGYDSRITDYINR